MEDAKEDAAIAMPWPGPQLPHAPYSLALPADSTPGVSIHIHMPVVVETEYLRAVLWWSHTKGTDRPPIYKSPRAARSGIDRSPCCCCCCCCCRWLASCLLCRRRRSSRALSSSRLRCDHSGRCCCFSCWPRPPTLLRSYEAPRRVGTLEMSSLGGHGRGEARARLRWTRQMHDRFVLAVAQLGGADKATPKSVMRAMAVSGLTVHHLKSHLQKYRLAVSQGIASPVGDNGDGTNERSSSSESQPDEYDDGSVADLHGDSSRSMAARMQREAKRRRQEQIEVQRHLQLRIEAQGRYMQSVLRRAHEALADHILGSPAGAEAAESELPELASAVETGCLSSSCRSPSPSPMRHRSADSCVTSSSSSEAESQAPAGAKWLHTCAGGTRDGSVEQPVQGESTFMQRHGAEEADAGAAAEDEDGTSSEIDLNR